MNIDQTNSTNRLMDAVTAVTKARYESEFVAKLENYDFAEQLVSDEGMTPPRIPGKPPFGGALLFAALQLLTAYHAALDFSKECSAILRLKSVSNEKRADWCRSLAWHYGYVLRERTRRFLNIVRDYLRKLSAPEAVDEKICELAREFKKQTDKQFSKRGKHVHEHQIDDPLVDQIRLIEMLAAHAEGEEWPVLLRFREGAVRKHVKEQVRASLDEVLADVESALTQSEQIWIALIQAVFPLSEDKVA